LLALIYLFVALEEIDHQVFSASKNHVASQQEWDEWSIWNFVERDDLKAI